MSFTRIFCTAALVCAVALFVVPLAGCQSLVPADISGMMKIVGGQMNTLSGEEILALTENPIVAGYAPGLQLTDAQADGIAQFLADNKIATLADLQALLLRAQTDPTSVVLPDGFLALFADFKLPEQQQQVQ